MGNACFQGQKQSPLKPDLSPKQSQFPINYNHIPMNSNNAGGALMLPAGMQAAHIPGNLSSQQLGSNAVHITDPAVMVHLQQQQQQQQLQFHHQQQQQQLHKEKQQRDHLLQLAQQQAAAAAAAAAACAAASQQQQQQQQLVLRPQTANSSTNQAVAPVAVNRVIVRALYRYEGQHCDDLAFEKDDFMIVQCDQKEAWWYAEHTCTKKKGYIPSNYVTVDDGSPTSLDAWYEISRREADRLLLMPGNPRGTYIIRASSDPKNFALSVRHYDESKQFFVVKHYKIRTLDNNSGFFISNRRTFEVIADLIKFYSNNSDGLCCCLSRPCPRQYRPPVQFRDIEINRTSIKLLDKLGHGSFGEVRRGLWNSCVDVAVKLLKPNSMDRDKFIGEAELMHKLRHKQIVQIIGICREPAEEPVYIVTELMVNGSLVNYLQTEAGRQCALNDFIDMMAQISDGMAYLESKNYVHRDLRAANILVGENHLVKVADFGLARVTHDDTYMPEEGAKFPIKWTAPEAALDRIFSVKSDVWSFGILMYEMVTYGRVPYPSMSNKQVIDEISRGYRMQKPQGPGIQCDDDLYNLMMNCWHEDPVMRPTFASLKDVFDNWTVHSDNQYHEQN